MKKAFLASKWWFYIPLISLLFYKKIAEWVFEPDNYIDRVNRYNLISFTIFIHVLAVFLVHWLALKFILK